MSAYANDVTVDISNNKHIKIIREYETEIGVKINQEKSMGLWFGT